MTRRDAVIAWTIAVVVAAAFGSLDGTRFQRILDEGIYLEGALRIGAGEAPYRDFFVLTGPGCFWLVAALFKLLGATLAASRWLPAIEFGFMTGAVYWLTAKHAGRVYGAMIAVLFVGLQAANPGLIQVNHRMDSAAFALAAAVCGSAGRWTTSGAMAAAAAWCTPPVVVIGPVLLWWSRSEGKLRAWTTGVAAVSIAAAGVLAWQGALGPMIGDLLWTTSNYSGPNRAMYGEIVGGWARLLAELTPVQSTIAVYLLGLPAVLPLIVAAGFLVGAWRTREERFLAAVTIALVLSAYPRIGGANLRMLGALPLILCAIALHRWKFWKPVLIILLLPAVAALTTVAGRARSGTPVATARGIVRMDADSQQLHHAVAQHVRPGDTMIAFPYEPIAVFLAGARNPIRYSFLQPGMMTAAQEADALDGLRRDPPRWVLYLDLPPESYLRIWPASDPARLRMPRIEEFLRAEYRSIVHIPQPNGTYQLLEFVRK